MTHPRSRQPVETATDQAGRPPRRHAIHWLLAWAGLCVIGGLVFLPALWVPFIPYDDPGFIYENERILSGLSWANLWYAFTASDLGYPKAITALSWMLNAELGGANPAVFHATNLLGHLVNGCVVMVLLRQCGVGFGWAWTLALLWVIHPMKWESVAWATERKDILMGLFALLGVVVYLRWGRRGGVGWYSLALGCMLLSLMNKPLMVVMPAVLLLMDIWPLQRMSLRGPWRYDEGWKRWPGWRLVAEKVPFLLLGIGWSALLLWVRQSEPAESSAWMLTGPESPWVERIANVVVAPLMYLGQTLVPYPLIFPHPWYVWSLAVVLGAASLVTLAVLAAWRVRASAPAWLVALGWHFVLMLPTLGLIRFGHFSMADRFMYLPMVGLLLPVGAMLTQRCSTSAPRPWRRGALVAVAVVLVAWTALSVRRGLLWVDPQRLWQQTIAWQPDNGQAHRLLAALMAQRGREVEWIHHLRRARQVDGNDYRDTGRLAEALMETGQPLEAARLLESLTGIGSQNVYLFRRLGEAYRQTDRPSDAILAYRRALKLDPDQPGVKNDLAVVLMQQRRVAEAENVLRQATAEHPDQPDLWANFGLLLRLTGRPNPAREAYRRALQLDPDHLAARKGYQRLREPGG